jgi:hypothetical protein
LIEKVTTFSGKSLKHAAFNEEGEIGVVAVHNSELITLKVGWDTATSKATLLSSKISSLLISD